MLRRQLFTSLLAGAALPRLLQGQAQLASREVFLERPAAGMPHKGKVLLAVQAHSDDIPLSSAGTVAKLLQEGYTGYLVSVAKRLKCAYSRPFVCALRLLNGCRGCVMAQIKKEKSVCGG